MSSFSTPFTGDTKIWENGNAQGWLTGQTAMNDISGVSTPVRADWTAYDPNAAAFQIGDQYTSNFDQMGSAAQGRRAPTMTAANVGAAQTYGGASINAAPSNQMRAGQTGLIGALQQRVAGQSPSVAELQMRQGQEAALKQARAIAASNPSASPALAQRQAQQAAENINLQTNQQAAQLRAQEQAEAERSLGGVLSGARQQDLGLATDQARMGQEAGLFSAGQQNQFGIQQAQLNQGANQANLQSALQQQQMNDQMTQFYMQQGFSRDQAAQMAAAQLEQLRVQQSQTQAQVAMADAEREQQANAGLIGAAGSLFGSFVSDERAKENIDDADDDVDELLEVLRPKRFDYKREHGGERDFVGFMAQDLEKSKAGKSIVREEGGVKRVDAKRGLMAALAAAARLHDRVSALEAA